ncbi:MAG TPA: GerW family sporulation protein [Myxococcota bacterium]|nr:GerW family sporulation protein [Myxococcota bacterium]HRY92739.1 GerW family sporulation protein [Myxococcota bacterium]HSA20719.1 GerW family sporulation protein [Myxococcota bacterium]
MEHLNGLMDLLAGRMADLTKSDLVAGEPLTFGPVTLVVLSRVTLGFGAGGGEGEGDFQQLHADKKQRPPFGKGKGVGAGAGGGGKARPVAVVAFGPEGVQILPVPERKGLLDKLFDRVPELIELAQKAQAKG